MDELPLPDDYQHLPGLPNNGLNVGGRVDNDRNVRGRNNNNNDDDDGIPPSLFGNNNNRQRNNSQNNRQGDINQNNRQGDINQNNRQGDINQQPTRRLPPPPPGRGQDRMNRGMMQGGMNRDQSTNNMNRDQSTHRGGMQNNMSRGGMQNNNRSIPPPPGQASRSGVPPPPGRNNRSGLPPPPVKNRPVINNDNDNMMSIGYDEDNNMIPTGDDENEMSVRDNSNNNNDDNFRVRSSTSEQSHNINSSRNNMTGGNVLTSNSLRSDRSQSQTLQSQSLNSNKISGLLHDKSPSSSQKESLYSKVKDIENNCDKLIGTFIEDFNTSDFIGSIDELKSNVKSNDLKIKLLDEKFTEIKELLNVLIKFLDIKNNESTNLKEEHTSRSRSKSQHRIDSIKDEFGNEQGHNLAVNKRDHNLADNNTVVHDTDLVDENVNDLS